LHVPKVNRFGKLVVVVKLHGGGELHQKAGNLPHFNLDLLLPDLEKSGVAVVHSEAIRIVALDLAHRCDKFLLCNLSHAAQTSTAKMDRHAVFLALPCPLQA
jgi:hypothetical protein